MAVPTISAVTPSSGHTRGLNVVKITGTNFRLPPAVVGHDPGDAQQTIKITMGGVDSTSAHAITATSGIAVVPTWTGPDKDDTPYLVSVRVANLDNNGDEIAGENATLANGYSYVRTRLTVNTIIQRTTEMLVRFMRRHVHPNTVITTSAMYDEDTADDLDSIKAAGLPLIKVIGPVVTENERLTLQIEEEEDDSGDPDQYTLKHPGIVVDLDFSIQCWSDDRHAGSIFNMAHAATLLIHKIGYLSVARDPDDSSLGDYSFPWALTEMPDFNLGDNLNGLRRATFSCEIREVQLDDLDGTIIERGYDITADDVDRTIELVV